MASSINIPNNEVLEEVDKMAVGFLSQSVAHAMGLAALNAASAQQQGNISAQAVTVMGASTVYSIGTAADVSRVKDAILTA